MKMKSMLKKGLAVALALAMVATLLLLSGCGKEDEEPEAPPADTPLALPYADLDLSTYVTLPNYDVYTTSTPKVEIDDEDVEAEIQSRLEEAATYETVTEGTVAEGDKIHVSFAGTLADGTTKDGMNSDDFEMTLGVTSMIDGFSEGLYGATIGEPVTMDLTFPDPYPNDPTLAGQPVTFVVTVKSKDVPQVPTLDEAFVKANSEAETVDEYRELVRKDLEETELETQLSDLYAEIWDQISQEAEVISYPEGLVEKWEENLDSSYHNLAEEQYGYGEDEWEQFLTDYFKVDQAEFDEQIHLLAEIYAKQELLTYAIAQKEDFTLTQGEYDEYLDGILEDAGIPSRDSFAAVMGMTLEDYAEENEMLQNVVLDKELELIYNRLSRTE